MTRTTHMVTALPLCLGCAAAAWGQDWRVPWVPEGFKAVVGSGALYTVTEKDRPKASLSYTLAFVVVGKEGVDGTEGYWLESRFSGLGILVPLVEKLLIVVRGKKRFVKRSISQRLGGPPLELPKEHPTDKLDHLTPGAIAERPWIPPPPKKVGTETITVPAGTFECEHYRGKTETGAVADVWISAQVTPYGVVKMVSKDRTVLLQKVLENETSQIKYEPEK